MFTLLLENRGARRLGAQGLLSLFAHLAPPPGRGAPPAQVPHA